jgi:uncharacterized membrane protein (DUF485 family)
MHGPSSEWGEDRASAFKTRVGIWMFVLYAVIYIGFVVVNTINPKLMGSDIGSLNLAVIYGFGLIIFAIMLATVYNAICSAAEEEFNDREPEPMSEALIAAEEGEAIASSPAAVQMATVARAHHDEEAD